MTSPSGADRSVLDAVAPRVTSADPRLREQGALRVIEEHLVAWEIDMYTIRDSGIARQSWAYRDRNRKHGHSRNDIPVQVMIALGCPYMTLDRVDTMTNMRRPVVIRARAIPAGDHPALFEWLMRLLKHVPTMGDSRSYDLGAVLGSLGCNQYWGQALQMEVTTYQLAGALLSYLNPHVNPRFGLYDLDAFRFCVTPGVLTILNDWLKPSALWVTLPSRDAVADAMFGAGWGLLRANTEADLASVILQERPPFLPGLCPAQEVQLSVPLPGDIGPNT
jgi:hypothetical protein